MNDTPQRTPSVDTPDSATIPLVEEQVKYHTQDRITGKVSISKQVHEDTVEVEETFTQEKVDIERVPINQYVDGSLPEIRHEGDTLIVPVLEEVIVKRQLLVEELHIKKTRETKTDTREITLKKETVNVHRSDDNNTED